MNNVERFLETQIYTPHPGSITPLKLFSRKYADWLDCPALQNYWTQHSRIQRALTDLGFSVGYAPPSIITTGHSGAIFIANITGPGSRQICGRALVIEDTWLLPCDATEQTPPCTKGGER